jgi:predicted phage terminase large subunit-like protein
MISKADAARELLRRREARASLLAFIRYINPDYIVSDFSRTVCAELQQFLRDVMAGLRPVLVLEAPPQHGKSDMVSRYLPAFVFGHFPNLRIAGLSYAKDLASDMNRDVQAIMSTPQYAALYPISTLAGFSGTANSDKFAVPNGSGTYIGQGVGGPLTGKRVDIGIIDDPIKNSKEALSPTVKESIWKWYGSTFLTRLSRNSGQIIMATRWATDDLSGRVLAANPKARRLSFHAINEQGEALVPDLHPIEKLIETKAALGDYFWSAMYQGSPKTLGGAVFKDHGVRYYLPKDLPAKFDKVIQSWDMTFKDTDGSDYVAGQVWAKAGANAYLLHEVRERMGFTASKKAVKDMSARYPDARRKLIEDKANGPAILDSLKSEVSGMVPIEPDGSKLARAHACTAEWEAGNVWLPHPDIAPWVKDFVDEVTTFPAAANDDRVDAMTQALRDLYSKRRSTFG